MQGLVADGGGSVKVELLVDAHARLGECVLWCEQARALYWTDIDGASLHRWQATDGRTRQWAMPEPLGSFALCARPSQLLLGLASGIALFDLDSGRFGPTIAVESEQPTTRLNDGRCDAQGRFVFGTFNPAEAAIGHFYRVDAELHVERLPLPAVAVANSIAFSPDGTRMYFTDSPTRRIDCADYHADGRIGTPRLFVELGSDEGYPDGSAVDADGGLWNAQWDGGCVVRYDSHGVETTRVELPAARPTCPAFGGEGFAQLFVSTARKGLHGDALAAQPAAGGVFVAQTAHRGRAEHRFVTGHHA
jgi:L-arabinonolactonase